MNTHGGQGHMRAVREHCASRSTLPTVWSSEAPLKMQLNMGCGCQNGHFKSSSVNSLFHSRGNSVAAQLMKFSENVCEHLVVETAAEIFNQFCNFTQTLISPADATRGLFANFAIRKFWGHKHTECQRPKPLYKKTTRTRYRDRNQLMWKINPPVR